MSDPHNLQRFVEAQEPLYARVLHELRAGRKSSHWIWFVFPQIQGLGHSPMAREFAIGSIEEAQAYLDHPVLGARLRECTGLVTAIEGSTIEQILGHPDNLKFCSSMTLFAHATSDNQVFLDALAKYFGGRFDRRTQERLAQATGSS
jgi:uncharacterized protein (DUF1810 family)